MYPQPSRFCVFHKVRYTSMHVLYNNSLQKTHLLLNMFVLGGALRSGRFLILTDFGCNMLFGESKSHTRIAPVRIVFGTSQPTYVQTAQQRM